jgi:hypothetical protein
MTVVSWGVARLFLAVWCAAFAIQTTDVLALIAPDACTEDVQGSAVDPCPEGCPRCLCCARVPTFVPQTTTELIVQPEPFAGAASPVDPSTTASPHGIYHVPKHS